jgi:hypothetical protein
LEVATDSFTEVTVSRYYSRSVGTMREIDGADQMSGIPLQILSTYPDCVDGAQILPLQQSFRPCHEGTIFSLKSIAWPETSGTKVLVETLFHGQLTFRRCNRSAFVRAGVRHGHCCVY